jgi:glycerol-3-phosphate dehydrogenase
MRRDLSALADTTFDLLVVGAGIYGACAAWDASLRGLSVAVVDQGDFGAATSANSLRIVHGGLRYLARGDFSRMRESIRERSTLLRIAPGLVVPLAVLVPTYGVGKSGRWAHGAALVLNDLVSWRRNRHLNGTQSISRGRLVSKDECLRLFPGFVAKGLTGGALWYDARLLHPERLTLAFVQAAAGNGAAAANYLRVEGLRRRQGAVAGANVTDQLTGRRFDIEARAVLVTAGPWTDEVTATDAGKAPLASSHTLGLNLVLGRRLAEVAVGVRGKGVDRYLFLTPHGDATLLGTWYMPSGQADTPAARDLGVRALIQEFNDACPGLSLSPRDIVGCQWGRLPLKAGLEPGRPDALAERPRVVDHGAGNGPRHLIAVEGVKYTTARLVAEQAVDAVFRSLERASPECRTSELLLAGAQVRIPLKPVAVSKEEILHVVREEMAMTLADIMYRRTALGTAPGPDRTTVEECARVAGAELGWDSPRLEAEIASVMHQAGVSGPSLEAVG